MSAPLGAVWRADDRLRLGGQVGEDLERHAVERALREALVEGEAVHGGVERPVPLALREGLAVGEGGVLGRLGRVLGLLDQAVARGDVRAVVRVRVHATAVDASFGAETKRLLHDKPSFFLLASPA